VFFIKYRKYIKKMKKQFFLFFSLRRKINTMPKLVSGFTLIELLVVISIISLLTSIIITNLNDARERGRMATNIQLEANIIHGIGDTLVGEWKFDQVTGATTPDTSSYANNGTVNGAVYDVTGGYNGKGAYLFDGSNKYIDIGTPSILNLNGLNSFTESAWVNVANGSGIPRTIIGRHTTTVNAMGTIRLDNNLLTLIVYTTSGFFAVSSDGKVPSNKWVYVTAVYDGSNALFYINGVLDSKKPVTGKVSASYAPIMIGRNSAGGENFVGKIDTVRIYTTTFTAMDIKNIYAKDLLLHQDLALLKE
jgi:prepilin-type N-terminal cleavage/methylation domain-containing protein